MKNNTWLLIANSSTARIFSLCKSRFLQTQKCQDLNLEERCEHADSRKKGSELISDRPGGFGNGSFSEGKPPKEQEKEIFAKNLVKKLETARNADPERDFIIAASPAFLGMLKKNLTPSMEKKVSMMIEKDYTSRQHHELASALMEHF